MSDTPQSDAVESEITDQPVTTNDSVLESDTSDQVQDESKEQVDEVQLAKDKANDAFNKQYGEKKQLERDLAVANEFRAKTEQAERERQAAAVGTLPEILDPLDDGYEDSIDKYKQAVNDQATYNANNQAYLNGQQLQQQQAAQAKQLEGQKVLNEHNGRVRALGIKPEAMIAAENTVMSYGLPGELLTHIAGMKDSPLVINHLAANPVEGYELANLVASNPYGVSAFLDKINEKASALKPKTSNTPTPATNLEGNGVDPELGKYKHIAGSEIDVGEAW